MTTELSNASIYTEFSGLSKLKLEARNSSPEALKEVAEQFEAFFLQLMLKQMRDTSLGEGIFDSQQSRFYQDMMDQQLSLTLAKQRTVGIADSIMRQLEHTVHNTDKAEKNDGLNSLPARKDFDHYFNPGSSAINFGFKQHTFKTPAEFIKSMRPHAEAAAEKLGVPANILLAQSALETGWGQKVIKGQDGNSSYNLFGIKADERWSGDKVRVASLEFDNGEAKKKVSEFRVYNSFKESFDDYVNFIKGSTRYQGALEHTNDAENYIKSLQDAGYATDPEYANKIINIINREAI